VIAGVPSVPAVADPAPEPVEAKKPSAPIDQASEITATAATVSSRVFAAFLVRSLI
jgi:hypothetical protein